jgi:16S rRNA (uracil1498-N3)-methyltransferase
MAVRDFASTRLFVRAALGPGASIDLDRSQSNYLVNVLRLADGDTILAFNGADGEWSARLAATGRKSWQLRAEARTRAQPPAADLHYLFAPLKQARLDYMVQKAVEMGAGRLRPVVTRHTQVVRLNADRLVANIVEAAEQCGILAVPTLDEPKQLAALLDGWTAAEGNRQIIFCDESAADADPAAVLAALQPAPMAVLIGPEGGFSDDERTLLHSCRFVTAIPLGPRILRADTAAVAALALVQAMQGDWRNGAPAPD